MNIEFSNCPWAIQPEKLIELQAVQASLMRGEKLQATRADTFGSGGFQVINGVAVIPLSGILAKQAGFLMSVFGGTSTEIVSRQFAVALRDPDVKSIVLVIDSPGGTVDGTQALADRILAARGQKTVVAIADGCMCSAAYWIGASADKVYASSAVAQVGSIGVVASHIDVSGLQAQRGIKTTEIAAGKYKRIASNYAPLSTEGRASIQESVDYLYSLFVRHIAVARGTTEQRVLNIMADGRVFIGQQAVSAGLVDGIMTLESLLKGDKTMEKGTRTAGPDAWASDREALHAKAKAYQCEHPGTDYMAALNAVSGAAVATAIGEETVTQNAVRGDIHKRAKQYQAAHPAIDYMEAVRKVARV